MQEQARAALIASACGLTIIRNVVHRNDIIRYQYLTPLPSDNSGVTTGSRIIYRMVFDQGGSPCRREGREIVTQLVEHGAERGNNIQGPG